MGSSPRPPAVVTPPREVAGPGEREPPPARLDELTPDPLPEIAQLEDVWSALAERGDNVFATWEWASTWWRHFGRGRPLRLFGCRRGDGEPVAIVPLYEAARRPVRVVRLVGHGAADELGPVCEPADRAAAARALAALLDDAPVAWDLTVADDLPADLPWAGLTSARRLVRRPSPAVDTRAIAAGHPIDRFVKHERRLAREGRLRYRTTDDPDRFDADFDLFLGLHRARWRVAGGSGAGRETFHRDFARLALRRGWLRLRFLELAGRAVAALYNLRFGHAESTYLTGRDPALDRHSVGLVLHAHAIRETAADGLGEYRFLRGGEAYKWRFADLDRGVETVARARGRRGCAALAALAAQPRLPRSLRRRVPAAFAWGTGAPPRGGGG